MITSTNTAIDPRILEQAADWLMRLQDSHLTEADRAAFDTWKQDNPEHLRAWHLAESLMRKLDDVPAAIALPALTQAERIKRETMSRLAWLMAIVPVGWLTWRFVPKPAMYYSWGAAYRTATGKRHHLYLEDGSHIHLNTATAIDVMFDAQQRRIQLHSGEILVQTATDPNTTKRPFVVTTAQGQLEALGTRFTVHQEEDQTHMAVFEGAVRITLKDNPQTQHVIASGQQASFTSTLVHSLLPVDSSAAAWKDGMLLIDNMRLADVVTMLARYRNGFIQCLPEVAELRISGAFPVDNTDQALQMLTTTYPLGMTSRLRGYWVTLIPRAPSPS